jgi:archaellin
MFFKMDKKGELGLGTIILFIAALLTAVIGAGVMVLTGISFQGQSLTTTQQSQGEITTRIDVVEVSATDGSDNDLEDFEMIVRLAPSSSEIKFNEIMFTFSTYNTTISLNYKDGGLPVRDQVTGYWTDANTNLGNYTIEYLQTATNHLDSIFKRGDVVKVHFASSRKIFKSEELRISIIPKTGTQTLVEFRTPAVINFEKTYMYPN